MGNLSKTLYLLWVVAFSLCIFVPAKVCATNSISNDTANTDTVNTDTTNYVLLLDQGTPIDQTGGNIEELAALLRGDLQQYNITVQIQTISNDKINSTDFSNSKTTPLAVIWIEQPKQIEQPIIKESENKLQNISVVVYFPAENSTYIRKLPVNRANSMGSVPLATLITGMIKITGLVKTVEPEPIEAKKPENRKKTSPLFNNHKTDNLRTKLGLEAMAAYALYPISNSNLFGISGSVSYFPVAPLAVRFGFSYMRDISPGDDRYRGFYAEWPLSIGGKYCFFHNNHEFNLDLSMLAIITSFSYQDRQKDLARQYYKHVNVGINIGSSYYYYPVKYFGLGLSMAGHLTSKSQRYWQSDKLIYANGNFSIRIMAGIIFDFLR